MKTKIFGHRGSAGTHPENTMISFKEAARVGADGIELDIQMTKDGVIVVIHDETVKRTTNGKHKGWVKDYTLKQIKKMDVSYKFKDKYGICEIPTLEEVFDWAKSNQLLINVEFKTGLVSYKDIEEKTLKMIGDYGIENRIVLSSFNHYSLVKCRRISSTIDLAILYMEGLYEPWDYAKRLKTNGIHPYHQTINKEIVEESKLNGIAVRPFTINDEKKMKQFIDFGCSAIITDYPKKALALT
ncbi:glycerophosphodiester phosphodiesterase [Fredinandcohnia onubensis]|uniref:glycerophosphodiester phosphodiesterase n=1 Tax=Fredinandcohnia onubensis TaxID=1571209 RepID=UPI000C0BC9DC|nr:glycerophosphodiester phosphodiesterase [Fredinandcohnia onubensis]